MVLSVVNEKSRFNEQSKAPKRKPTKDYVRIYKLFMQNKPNFRNNKMNINTFATMRYGKLDTLDGRKNKPNSNPIKPKTKPIQTQFNPKQTQFKANQTQFQMFYLRLENIMLASAVRTHIIAVRNILNCNDRLAKPWSKITLCNPESASRPTFRIISLVLFVLSKERFMHGDYD
jgi:hypothetical protein